MFEAALSNALFATAFACLVYPATRILRRPAIAHALWLIVLIKLLTPSVLTVDLAGLLPEAGTTDITGWPSANNDHDRRSFSTAGASIETSSGPVAYHGGTIIGPRTETGQTTFEMLTTWHAPAMPSASWRQCLTIVWIGGIIVIATLAFVRILSFQVQLNRIGAPSGKLQSLAVELSSRLKLRRTPTILTVGSRTSPMVWTFGWQVYVLIPRELIGMLGEQQTATLLAHELAHIKRRDHWVRWMELACVTLYWWLPVSWWARRNLRRAEEECCDAVVLSVLPNKERDYVSTLLQAVEFLLDNPRSLPMTASGIGSTQFLRRRCEMILHKPSQQTASSLARILPLLVAAGVLPWGFQPGAMADDATDTETRGVDVSDVGPEDAAGAGAYGSESIAVATDDFGYTKKTTKEVRSKIERLTDNQTIAIGDIQIRLSELLSLKSFVPSKGKGRHDNSILVTGESGARYVYKLDELRQGPQDSPILEYAKPSRVFTQVSYIRPDRHPDFFKFVVSRKYDAKSARARLVEQVSDVLGEPSGEEENRWYRVAKIDDREAVLEFRVDDSNEHMGEGPSFHIVVRYRADW